MRGKLFGLGKSSTQAMEIPKKGAAGFKYARTYGPGSTSWVSPAAATYRFVQAGGGGGGDFGGSQGGGSGALTQTVRKCAKGETVIIAIATTFSVNAAGPNCILTFADGKVVTAGGGGQGGAGFAGGVASGGDINVNGNAASAGIDGGAAVYSGLFGPSGRGAKGGGYNTDGSLLIVAE